MSFLEMVKSRCSVRGYTGRKVEPEKLEKILSAAHAAPTAANLQPVRLIVVQEQEGLDKLGTAANIYGAPLAIIVCSQPARAWTRPLDGKNTSDIDASILTDHMMPQGLEPVNILAVGYASGAPTSPDRHAVQRIPIASLVSFEMYSPGE